ncbi:MAG TPA: Y-family DNA polymerase [Candidatus Saccharimonadales bacterium]|nr:Y-family DNA polymerase [Candidatus Saccharimonadales bacterium]
MYALIDCNNFFVSCERIFRPDLEGRPVVVLSSNDGCAVARSNEAKQLGIPMGAPAFKLRQQFRLRTIASSLSIRVPHEVVALSGNFSLYGDISRRIVDILTAITPQTEVYSVDESFLGLSQLDIKDYTAWGRGTRDRIWQEIGVPVSVGIAPTKTLAKLAAQRAKKDDDLHGVLTITGNDPADEQYLDQTPIEDIWGVGRRLAPKLRAEGVHTALDLAHMSPHYAQQLMGIHGRQMVCELSGTVCLPLQTREKPQQTIMRGRQFGEDTSELTVVEAAIASMTARAARHLRRNHQLARLASVLLSTNRNKPGYRQIIAQIHLDSPSNDTGLISARLLEAVRADFNPRLSYHKAEVMLDDLSDQSQLQTDLFGAVSTANTERTERRMQAFDDINQRYGDGLIRYAAENLSHAWQPKHRLSSPAYTTSWSDLPVAHLHEKTN